jgi:hypothetical protein
MLDYYINKTSELLDVYETLNNTIEQIRVEYCSPKNNTKAEATHKLNIDFNTTNTTTENENITTTNKNESGGGESNVISIFVQKMQDVANKAGLPSNYVQTRLQELSVVKSQSKKLKNKMRKARHI